MEEGAHTVEEGATPAAVAVHAIAGLGFTECAFTAVPSMGVIKLGAAPRRGRLPKDFSFPDWGVATNFSALPNFPFRVGVLSLLDLLDFGDLLLESESERLGFFAFLGVVQLFEDCAACAIELWKRGTLLAFVHCPNLN